MDKHVSDAVLIYEVCPIDETFKPSLQHFRFCCAGLSLKVNFYLTYFKHKIVYYLD